MAEPDFSRVVVYTIGHSTRSLDDLVAALRSFSVGLLADVRTVPRSRYNPQFNLDALAEALPMLGLDYVHLSALGGLRHPRKSSPNRGWRNASFRGYADYMATPEFAAGLEVLRVQASASTVAIMCAEAVPWRCHRSLIADGLTVRGAVVEHIMSVGKANRHHLTTFARVDGVRITYPGSDS